MFCFNTVTTEDPRKGLFRPRAFRPSFINRVRPTTTTTQKPRISITENEKIEEKQNEPVQRNRVSLFSSPRRRFRPRDIHKPRGQFEGEGVSQSTILLHM